MEVLNNLVGYDGLSIYQQEEWFRFSLESVLLPNFATINMRDKNIMDFCSGNAPIPLILTRKTKAKIYGVEIQKEVYDLAVKSVIYNHLDKQIEMINDDVRNLKKHFSSEFFDLITVNPPYFKVNSEDEINLNKCKAIARHEKELTLMDVIMMSRYLLKNNGRLSMVHRTERLVEILLCLEKNNLVPKKLQFIYSDYDRDSKLFMIEAVKNGKSGMKLMAPLYIHNQDGSYRPSILKILGR